MCKNLAQSQNIKLIRTIAISFAIRKFTALLHASIFSNTRSVLEPVKYSASLQLKAKSNPTVV